MFRVLRVCISASPPDGKLLKGRTVLSRSFQHPPRLFHLLEFSGEEYRFWIQVHLGTNSDLATYHMSDLRQVIKPLGA